ncbi:IncV family inclusion membrane protein [Candidatus Chlamydia corallus]|uniref:IncV family inclusion membrane protein n=1 Tax=Candidatus Chlamydia corallus TaxID=2038470 RepID=UPI000C2FD2BC|nr:IncV family inclusion membrane protein [Candidatus Chlamydia corallus]
MSNSPINPLGQPQVPAEPSPSRAPGIIKNLKTSSTGLFRRFITVPDRYPKMRYVYDIGIIALAAIAILSILLTASGSSIMLYALAPALVMGALGVSLLISDIMNSPKAKKIAERITAIVVPIIVLAIAVGLIAGAFAVSGGTMLVFANPMFIMGLITVGLYFMSLNKLTLNYFRTEHLLKTQKKTQETIDVLLDSPSPEDAKKIALESKSNLAADARRKKEEAAKRQDARHRHIHRRAQGSMSYSPDHTGKHSPWHDGFPTKKSLDESQRPGSISPPFEGGSHPSRFEEFNQGPFTGSKTESSFIPITPGSPTPPSFPASSVIVHPEPIYPKDRNSSIPRISSSSRRSSRDGQNKQQQQKDEDSNQDSKKSKKKSKKTSTSRTTPPPGKSSPNKFDPKNPFSDGYDERENQKKNNQK